MLKNRFVISFSEQTGLMNDVLGNKGMLLNRMSLMNLPVPPGFTITTHAYHEYKNNGDHLLPGLWGDIISGIKSLETNKRFGDSTFPLIISCRSGAPVSMPGMMDTILNIGLNKDSLVGFAKIIGSKKLALDIYQKFIFQFSTVVLGLDSKAFTNVLSDYGVESFYGLAQKLSEAQLSEIVEAYLELVEKLSAKPFPTDPYEQLKLSICAVFNSWVSQRATTYRQMHDLPDSTGTAVNIQQMVFGLGENSCTGVIFTRNPINGENKIFGEYLPNTQGDEVVSGISTPKQISYLTQEMPEIYQELANISHFLEQNLHDMQEIEFTVENKKLWILQTRSGKRTKKAATKIIQDMYSEGLVSDDVYNQTREDVPRDEETKTMINLPIFSKGLPASPGLVSGQIVLDPQMAIESAKSGQVGILVRHDTNPEDLPGMLKSAGLLSAHGGMTSHTAVVARSLNIPAIVGAELDIDFEQGTVSSGEQKLKIGDWITIDGTTGKVYTGKI